MPLTLAPPPQGPTGTGTAPPPPAPTPLPLPSDGHGSRQYWKQEVDAAVERLNQYKPEWDANVLSYRAKPLNQMPTTDSVVVPRDFAFVEQKGAQLFFQTPEVHLKTNLAGLADAVAVFQPVLNYYLSEDEANALAMMNEVIFDALCPSGIMCSKLGYECFTDGHQDLPTGNQIPDPDYEGPAQLPGSVLGIGTPAPEPPLIPEMQSTPKIIHERYFWERFSPAAAVIPHNFNGSVYDKAPYLGYRFRDDWQILKKRFNLPDTMDLPRSRSAAPEDLVLKGESTKATMTRGSKEEVTGVELWYRTSFYDPSERHPERIRQLILLDGYDVPLVHRDSPYQRTTQDGRLIGMIGFPIHIGALRYVSDTAYPPSECSISRASNEELNKSRTQMMLQRDRSIPMRYADLGRVGGESGLAKIQANLYQSIIPLASYDVNNPPIGVMALAQFPRENFTFNDYLDRDLEQVWAMGANQRGQETSKSLTATEVSKIDAWANTRLDKERRQVLTYYIRGTRKVGSLLQMFLSDEQITMVIGQDKLQRVQAWDRANVPNMFAYSANPDSAIRIDQTQARTQILKLYEMLAKDPNVRRTELLTEICRQWNLDPTTLIIPELPEKGPDPVSVSIAMKPEFLDTTNPNFPMYLAILVEAGYRSLNKPVKNEDTGQMEPSPVDQAMAAHKLHAQMAGTLDGGTVDPVGGGTRAAGDTGGGDAEPPQPPHPGAAPKAEHLSKHAADEGGAGNLRGPNQTVVN